MVSTEGKGREERKQAIVYPILFSIGPINIYSYGFMLAVAFLSVYYFMTKRAHLFGISKETISNLAFLLLISGIIGARLFYVIIYTSYFMRHPLEILLINRGGLVFYGGFIFAITAGLLFAKTNRISISNTADLIAPFVALGHAIGRIGCFLNGCCYGKPTLSHLGVGFPGSSIKVWPTQIFSSIGLLLIFMVLLFIQKRRAFKGQVISLYIILYGLFRFLIEFLRGDLAPVLYGLTTAQLVSMAMIIVGVLFYTLGSRSKTV